VLQKCISSYVTYSAKLFNTLILMLWTTFSWYNLWASGATNLIVGGGGLCAKTLKFEKRWDAWPPASMVAPSLLMGTYYTLGHLIVISDMFHFKPTMKHHGIVSSRIGPALVILTQSCLTPFYSFVKSTFWIPGHKLLESSDFIYMIGRYLDVSQRRRNLGSEDLQSTVTGVLNIIIGTHSCVQW